MPMNCSGFGKVSILGYTTPKGTTKKSLGSLFRALLDSAQGLPVESFI